MRAATGRASPGVVAAGCIQRPDSLVMQACLMRDLKAVLPQAHVKAPESCLRMDPGRPAHHHSEPHVCIWQTLRCRFQVCPLEHCIYGSSAYCYLQAVQETFRRCQASYDPNSLVALLQHYPYHVDTLLVLSDLERSVAHHESAEEFLQKAVYALEMAWPARANPAIAPVGISYDEPINRPLFRALFLHAQVLC